MTITLITTRPLSTLLKRLMNKNIVAKQTFIDWLAECPVKAIRNDDLNFGDHKDSEEINYSFYIPYE